MIVTKKVMFCKWMCIKFYIIISSAREGFNTWKIIASAKGKLKKKFRLGQHSNRWLPPAIKWIGSWSCCEFAIHPKKVKVWKFIFLNCGSTIQVLKIERYITKAGSKISRVLIGREVCSKMREQSMEITWSWRNYYFSFSNIQQFSTVCTVKPRENGRNIVGQQLLTLSDVTCCVHLYTLLRVVESCCAKFETGETFSTMLGVIASVCT